MPNQQHGGAMCAVAVRPMASKNGESFEVLATSKSNNREKKRHKVQRKKIILSLLILKYKLFLNKFSDLVKLL